MPTLLVTNDFPPRVGGIQSYLQALADRLPAGELVVHAPAWPGAAAFDAARPYPVERHRTSLMLPGPEVARRAAELARAHDVDAVWFGAAAPLALLGEGLRRAAGVRRIVASTHGHEIGWSMLPGARQVLRRIATTTDVLTVVSGHTRRRLAPACGPAAALEPLRPGVDTAVFRPDPGARAELRGRYGIGDAPLVVCVGRLVPRKGQDVLIRALPRIRAAVPGARLLLVGDGPHRARLQRLAGAGDVAEAVVFAGAVPQAELPGHHAVADVFAMPCRTRGRGLDVEGLGIAFLEAAASGVPVVAGASGGAPETVRPGRTGAVVDGRDVRAVADAVAGLLADPARAAGLGAAGRAWMAADWTWGAAAARLHGLLTGQRVEGSPDAVR